VFPTCPVAPVSVEDPGTPVAPVSPVVPTEPVTPDGPVGPVEPPPTGTSREIIPVNGSIYKILLADPTGKLGKSTNSIFTVSDTLNSETDLFVEKFVNELSFATLPKL
jgi:hypothetical protein